MLDDFRDGTYHEQYWSNTSVQEVLARWRRDVGWRTTRRGIVWRGQREVLDLVTDGLSAMDKISNNVCDKIVPAAYPSFMAGGSGAPGRARLANILQTNCMGSPVDIQNRLG